MKKKKRKFDFTIKVETTADATWIEALNLVKNRLSTSLSIKDVKVDHSISFLKRLALIIMGAIAAIIFFMILANISF